MEGEVSIQYIHLLNGKSPARCKWGAFCQVA